MVPPAAAQYLPPDPEEPVQRRDSHLGLGLGYVGTSSVVGEVFGDGTDAAIYVNQKIYKILGLRASFGSIYLGSTDAAAKEEVYLKGLDFFGSSFTNFTMSFPYITIGPSIQTRFGENHSVLASAAFVFYHVKLDISSLDAHRFAPKNRRYGLNATFMYSFWIGSSWGLNAQLQWYRINTGSAESDLYYTFVREDSDPQFVSFLVGVQLGYR
jgi:hypothetical protein